MLDFGVQIPQLLAIAVANFFLGWLWYSPVLFMKPWAAGLGITPDPKNMTEEQKAQMPFLFAGAIVASLLLSFVLQVLVRNLGAETVVQGAIVGKVVWLGQILPFALGTLWEGRKPVVIAINAGNYLVANAAFGAVLAVWR